MNHAILWLVFACNIFLHPFTFHICFSLVNSVHPDVFLIPTFNSGVLIVDFTVVAFI